MRALLILTQWTTLLYGSKLAEKWGVFETSGPLDNLRFVCYGLILLAAFVKRTNLRAPNMMDIIAAFMFVFAFYSYTYSIEPQLTLARTIAMALLYLAIFWSLSMSCESPQKAVQFTRALVFSWFLFFAATAVFLVLRSADCFDVQESEYRRFSGLMGNANSIGDFSAIILPLVFWNALQRRRFTSVFLLFAVCFSLLFSFSRNAVISGLIGTSVFFYISLKNFKLFRAMFIMFILLLVFLYFNVFGFLLPSTLLRGQENLAMLGGRVEAWQAAVELIKRQPFHGYGFGTESLLFKYFEYRFELHSGDYVHNSFLGLMLQLGVLPTVIFYGAFFILLIRSFLGVMKIENRYRLFMIALYSSVVVGFLTSFAESWLYSPGSILAFPYYVCLMLLLRMMEFNRVAAQEVQGKAVKNRRRRRWFSSARKIPA